MHRSAASDSHATIISLLLSTCSSSLQGEICTSNPETFSCLFFSSPFFAGRGDCSAKQRPSALGIICCAPDKACLWWGAEWGSMGTDHAAPAVHTPSHRTGGSLPPQHWETQHQTTTPRNPPGTDSLGQSVAPLSELFPTNYVAPTWACTNQALIGRHYEGDFALMYFWDLSLFADLLI